MVLNKSPSNEQRSKDNLKRGSNYQAKHFFLFKSVSYVYCSSMRLLNWTKDQLCAHLIGYLYVKKHDWCCFSSNYENQRNSLLKWICMKVLSIVPLQSSIVIFTYCIMRKSGEFEIGILLSKKGIILRPKTKGNLF